jgi:hypothetical protein
MSNGHLLIAEVHQRVMTSPVEAVYPSPEEAETMIVKINHHLPVFVYNYLMDNGLNKESVINLVKSSWCPTLVMQIPNCKWDGNLMTVVTPDDNNDKELYSKLEAASGFKDELGLTKKCKKKKGYLKPELLYNLDDNCSIKTLHDCNDKVRRKEGAESELDGKEEEKESMSEDPKSKSNHTKSHQALALREAEGTRRGVHSAASPSVGTLSQHDTVGGK